MQFLRTCPGPHAYVANTRSVIRLLASTSLRECCLDQAFFGLAYRLKCLVAGRLDQLEAVGVAAPHFPGAGQSNLSSSSGFLGAVGEYALVSSFLV